MRSVEDCLDDLQDDAYPYSETLIEFVDEEQAESTLRAMCIAEGDRDILLFAKSLRQAINDAMRERAEAESKKSFNPLYDGAAA
jgi:hypothetical protein